MCWVPCQSCNCWPHGHAAGPKVHPRLLLTDCKVHRLAVFEKLFKKLFDKAVETTICPAETCSRDDDRLHTSHVAGRNVGRKRLRFAQSNEYNVAVNINIVQTPRTKRSSNVETENDCWTKLQEMGQQG